MTGPARITAAVLGEAVDTAAAFAREDLERQAWLDEQLRAEPRRKRKHG